MKILFHENSLCARGTAVALFDYAYFCKHLFGVDAHVIYNIHHPANDSTAIKKFEDEFGPANSYATVEQLQQRIDVIEPDAFFMEKSGKWDGVISKTCKNWIHSIAPCKITDTYGDKFYCGSRWLKRMSDDQIEYIPYIVNLPKIKDNYRAEYNIPADAIVFGRNGGKDTFDLGFVQNAVKVIVNTRPDVYFMFQGTDKFYEHDRIIYLPTSSDLNIKAKFINTTDALLHARHLGESFGATCAEFSFLNKPVITWLGSPERNHIETLGDKGFYYNDYNDVISILDGFKPNPDANWNCYEESTPEIAMEKFKKLYLND